MREHGSLHIPDVSQQNDFPIVNVSGSRTFLIVPLRQQGEVVGTLGARRHRGSPLHPGADQAPRNLREPGGYRVRERAAVPRTQGVVGTTDSDE